MISLSWSDQDAWLSAFEHCNGKSQSPINIDTHKVFSEPRLPPIKLEGYDLTGSHALTLINDGHTCESRPFHTKHKTYTQSHYLYRTVHTRTVPLSVYQWLVTVLLYICEIKKQGRFQFCVFWWFKGRLLLVGTDLLFC